MGKATAMTTNTATDAAARRGHRDSLSQSKPNHNGISFKAVSVQQQAIKQRRVLGEIDSNTLYTRTSLISPWSLLQKSSNDVKVYREQKWADGNVNSIISESQTQSTYECENDNLRETTLPLSPHDSLPTGTIATEIERDMTSSITPVTTITITSTSKFLQSPTLTSHADLHNCLNNMRVRLAFAQFKVKHGMTNSTADQVMSVIEPISDPPVNQKSVFKNQVDLKDDSQPPDEDITREDEESWWIWYRHHRADGHPQAHRHVCTCT